MENVLNMCRYKRPLYTTALQTLPNAETLYYESPLNQSNKNYNGNISGMSSLVFNEKENIFHYKYDNLNRLTESIYAEINGDKDFSELFNYDKMGNITSLQRYGQSRVEFIYWMPPKPVTPVPVYEQIEDLDFAYSGNQVVSIQNNIESSSNVFRQPTSFKNYSNLGEEYRYDNNGNMIMDLNKNISTIRYNSLNLPTILQTKYGNTTEYLYSSSGMKLRTIHKTSRTDLMVPVGMIKPTDAYLLNVLTTDYIGNKVYENGKLKRVLTETGYIQDGHHYFYLKDHLGNNCVVVDESQNIIQHTTYYASGCFNTSQSTSQPYFYNGKEYDFMHGVDLYDYLARQFYSSIMRFTTPDPLAHKYYNISPYAYCANNPVNRVDPDGRYWKEAKDEEYAKTLQQEMGNKAKSEQKSLDKLNAKIAKNQEAGKDVSKDQAKAAGMQANIDNLNSGISELTAMGETAEQGFTYNMTDGDVGYTSVDENGVIVMDIAGNGSVSNGVHESSHGYDFWKGGGTTKGNFLDRETKAYGRQFSFGGSSVMPASDWYKPINSLSDITGSYVLGIRHNNEYIYGKMYHGSTYDYRRMQRAFRMAKRGQW